MSEGVSRREAVRLAMYDHVAQVSAWLMNRPRGNSLDRRLRDTGSMYGSNCMSCHTQSGVWGPAGPLANGYRIEMPASHRDHACRNGSEFGRFPDRDLGATDDADIAVRKD